MQRLKLFKHVFAGAEMLRTTRRSTPRRAQRLALSSLAIFQVAVVRQFELYKKYLQGRSEWKVVMK